MPISRADYRVHGMDCAEEVSLLRRQLSGVRGVRDLRFDVLAARMTVEYDTAFVAAAGIVAAVRATGMTCEPWQGPAAAAQPRGRLVLPAVSGLALAAGMAWEWAESGDFVAAVLAHQHGHAVEAVPLVCFLAAILAGLSPALRKAWAAVLQFRPDMNALVALSAAGAAALGEWTEAATLAFLFSLAGILEGWSLERARAAITRLLNVVPRTVNLVHGDHTHAHPVERIAGGSLVRVSAGERMPCDGVVVAGTAYLNQALLTGESVAVEKAAGAQVWAGALVEEGTVDVRASGAAADATLARLLRMVEDSRSRRAPAVQFIEVFARYYMPAILALACAVAVLPPLVRGGAWSHWIYQGLVILLISCPCALVISTPVTITAALTSAAQCGVLFKGGAFLEQAAKGGSGLRVAVGGAASDLEMEAAGIVIVAGGPARLAFLAAHARRAMRVVRQNVVIALGLKILFLAAAFAGMATLWMAVAADMGATLLVVFNGLRLVRAKA